MAYHLLKNSGEWKFYRREEKYIPVLCGINTMANGNLRFTMLIKRKPDISEEEFHKYWTEVHPSVVNEWLAKHGVVQYIQVRRITTKYLPTHLGWRLTHIFPVSHSLLIPRAERRGLDRARL